MNTNNLYRDFVVNNLIIAYLLYFILQFLSMQQDGGYPKGWTRVSSTYRRYNLQSSIYTRSNQLVVEREEYGLFVDFLVKAVHSLKLQIKLN